MTKRPCEIGGVKNTEEKDMTNNEFKALIRDLTPKQKLRMAEILRERVIILSQEALLPKPFSWHRESLDLPPHRRN